MQISMRHLPAASHLFLDYLEDWPRVQRFYPHSYALESITAFARTIQKPEPEDRERLCSVLAEQQRSWGGGQRGVEKLAAGAVAVVTGQQPVLFTGPHLSILKAVSAVKLARKLELEGVNAVPVYWVAAEDHDHKEIEAAWVLDRESRPSSVSVDLSGETPTPAGWMQFRDDIRSAIETCLACLPQSEFAADIRGILEDSYKPGLSPVEAFARMMARLFKGSELTFVNPLHPELKRLARPTMDLVVRKNAEVRAAVSARSRAISDAGYHEQVKVDENFTGLFAYRGRSRHVLRPHDLAPDLSLSPNVLLRPVVQDAIFPTAVYIAGPSEIAYFAQAAPIYETLGRTMPPIFPRISATIVEPRIGRALEKYEIGVAEVWAGRESLKRKAVEGMDDGRLFDRLRARIEEELESLKPSLHAIDPTLVGAMETSRHKMLHQVETLHARYVNAAAKRHETMERHLDAVSNSLYPEKKPQERVVNITSFLVRYGAGVIERLQEKLTLEIREHQVIDI